MILLLTDGAPKTNSVVEKTVQAIKKEVELFKKEYKQTTFKVLTLLLGRGKKSKEFVNKLTQETVRTLVNTLYCRMAGVLTRLKA